ncbi:deoxyribodipyrimidine photo-lyase [Brevundimonas sp. 2R-24]|uniref:Deoxyribodipyrimidine photo-lyase n=1 Tax=Peiella sedimenti TaxID=3061083 RepID=A0ABT8SJ86_9CAUL|nr:deoxyribodipyrimidine photo-lyase [Caulobacteraceae bacterium XZ-24]
MASDAAPVLFWFGRDLRLGRNAALSAACAAGPVIPVFILDDEGVDRPLGGASRWWLHHSLAALAKNLEAHGARLILRRGRSCDVLAALAQETGARRVVAHRRYEPDAAAMQAEARRMLARSDAELDIVHETGRVAPEDLLTQQGRPYQVFGAFDRALKAREAPAERIADPTFSPPPSWPASEALSAWGLRPVSPDWASQFGEVWTPGEAGAQARLHRFLDEALQDYPENRDRPDRDGTSGLSPHLRWGEIAPDDVLAAARFRRHLEPGLEAQVAKLETELNWRAFGAYLLFHDPDLGRKAARPAYDKIRWRNDPVGFRAWSRGRTGVPIVDAGMRQLWRTGFMHNRVRMIVASFLVKNLLIDWRRGEAWFWDTLVDADPASNAMNWQWAAGSGVDAAPYFRVFNPVTQGERFDPDGVYVRRWVPELARAPAQAIHAPWTLPSGPPDGYPAPIVDLRETRLRALDAYRQALSA